MIALLPLSVMLPLFGAGLVLAFRGVPTVTRVISVTTLAIQLVAEAAMLLAVDASGPMVMHLGGWSAPVGITLVADRFAAILMVVSTVVTLVVLVYAIAQQRGMQHPDGSTAAFHPAMLIMAAGVSNAFVAGDLFNLFVSFEILLTASYVLLTLGGTVERLRAGAPYVVVSLLSSVIFLSAIALVYAATGTVNLAELSVRLADVSPGTASVLQALLLVTFGIKAAVWPMSAWLPDSYPSAPAPVTAVFAGLLTKVGIYAIIRTQTLLFGGEGFRSVLMWAALATMLIGILGAVAQADIKRMLSFTLVSHIGYMLYGVALGSQLGLAAAVYYVVHHILVQTALFLAAGVVEHLRGTTAISQLGGMVRTAPVLAVLFFVPAMNLAGIPPLSGFLGKVGLFEAGFADGGTLAVVLIAGGTVTSLATLYAIVRVWGRVFWRPTPRPEWAAAVARPGSAAGDATSETGEDTDPDAPEALTLSGGAAGLPAGPAVATAGEGAAGGGAAGRGSAGGTAGGAGGGGTAGGNIAGGGTAGGDIVVRVRPDPRPKGMLAATAAVVLAGVLLTVAAGPAFGLAERTATDLGHPGGYVTAVVGSP